MLFLKSIGLSSFFGFRRGGWLLFLWLLILVSPLVFSVVCYAQKASVGCRVKRKCWITERGKDAWTVPRGFFGGGLPLLPSCWAEWPRMDNHPAFLVTYCYPRGLSGFLDSTLRNFDLRSKRLRRLADNKIWTCHTSLSPMFILFPNTNTSYKNSRPLPTNRGRSPTYIYKHNRRKLQRKRLPR